MKLARTIMLIYEIWDLGGIVHEVTPALEEHCIGIEFCFTPSEQSDSWV